MLTHRHTHTQTPVVSAHTAARYRGIALHATAGLLTTKQQASPLSGGQFIGPGETTLAVSGLAT